MSREPKLPKKPINNEVPSPTKPLSPSIVSATEQVVMSAVKMERSDSVLFSEEEEDEGSLSDNHYKSMEDDDEEEPSIEALLSMSMRETHIVHARHVSSIEKHSSSMASSDLGEVGKFMSLETSDDDDAPEPAIPPPEPLKQAGDFSHTWVPSSPAEILESCGAMPLSLPELRTLYLRRDVSDSEIATSLLNARQHPRERRQPLQNGPLLNAGDEPMLLHSIFVTFCSPSPSRESVSRILSMEKKGDYDDTHNISLPKDTLISVSGAPKMSVISLLTHQPKIHLLRMPLAFQLAFFRTLIRLLTNETDAEYNSECLFTCDWVEEDERMESFGQPQPEDEMRPEIAKRREAIIEMRQSLLETMKVTPRPNQLYTVVRFRSGTAWNENVVTSLLTLLSVLLDDDERQLVLAPVSRLIGLCATAGIEVKELREMLTLAGRPFPETEQAPTREPGLDRLLMIRALSNAAEGASRSSLLGKASPRYFFNFGLGHGLARTFQSISTWPFRNDFGLAVWFRAENLESTNARQCPKLFSARTHDGGGIDVSLVPLQKKRGSDAQATVIAVTVYDSQANKKEVSEVQQIKLERCILLPQVWYHVAVRHTRSRLKGVFSMSSRQQVSIMLDGKIMVTESLKFPKISMSDSGGESPGSLLRSTIRRQSGRPSGSTLTIQCGANFEGQTGSFYVFNDNVSHATLRSLYEITGGTDGIIKRRSLLTEGSSWDERRSSIAVRSHALSVEITEADVEEIVLSSHENEAGAQSDSNMINAAAAIADMGDEGEENSDLPIELSKSSFGSKLFLVWDPQRVEDQVALELHSGAHVKIDVDKVQAWHIEGAKRVVASIGGVQALIPVFRAGLTGGIERCWPKLGGKQIKSGGLEKRRKREKHYITIPCLFYMLSAFLRDHGENAREMLRCGGIDIIEQLLVSNKALGMSSDESHAKETLMSVLSVYSALGRLLVSSLLDIASACSHYTGLETIVYSRLLFNFHLWFSGQSQAYGVALYATLLPVLSSLSKTSPRKVRDCVGVRPIIEQLREYTNVGDNEVSEKSCAVTSYFMISFSYWLAFF